jgi:hypothetical protein
MKLLLSLVTAGIEALVISGNKFLYACIEICRLYRAIQNRRCGMVTSGVVVLHDNVLPHIVAGT